MHNEALITITEGKLQRLNNDIASYQMNGDIEKYNMAIAEFNLEKENLIQLQANYDKPLETV